MELVVDSQRFDRIARSIAQKGTRRSLFAGMGALAGVAALKPFAAAAACRTCPGDSRSCGRENRCFSCVSGRDLVCYPNGGGKPRCCTRSGNCTTANERSCP
jgi:hypothetical protein